MSFHLILCTVCFGFLALASAASGGVYLDVDDESLNLAPFIVVHPFGYNGTGGEINLKICPADPNFNDALRNAIALWNQLQPSTGNCLNCFRLEDPFPDPSDPDFDPDASADLTSILLHELGHCAMGLGHTNWSATSFTSTRDVSSFNAGADMTEGSRDDSVTPFPGSRVIHWFRKADNNPILVDGLTIDQSTYSRRFQDFPAGTTWPANGNKKVSEDLGFADTQSLMYSSLRTGSRFIRIDADAVNTVKFGMTGIDSIASTSDDYTVNLEFHYDCATADIAIEYFTPQGPDESGIFGACVSEIVQIDMNNTVHYRISQVPIIGPIPFIQVNDEQRLDIIFADDFESGDLSRWMTNP